MTEYSEEGDCEGFRMDQSQNRKVYFQSNGLKIPHMGWNNLSISNSDSSFDEISTDNFFYFVHSYYVSCDE